MQAKHDDSISTSVAQSLGPTSLGNPDVVLAVLSQFCAACSTLFVKLGRQEISSAQYADQYLAAVRRAAATLDGQSPDYVAVPGWSNGPLSGQLRAMLPAEWMSQQRRDTFSDDPIAMYLDMLAAHLGGAMQAAQGDDARLADHMRPLLQQAVRIITGVIVLA